MGLQRVGHNWIELNLIYPDCFDCRNKSAKVTYLPYLSFPPPYMLHNTTHTLIPRQKPIVFLIFLAWLFKCSPPRYTNQKPKRYCLLFLLSHHLPQKQRTTSHKTLKICLWNMSALNGPPFQTLSYSLFQTFIPLWGTTTIAAQVASLSLLSPLFFFFFFYYLHF